MTGKEHGRHLQRLRKRAGITQQDFARALGYSHASSIVKIEAGKTRLPRKKFDRAAEVLHTTAEDVAGDTIIPEEIEISQEEMTANSMAAAYLALDDIGRGQIEIALAREKDRIHQAAWANIRLIPFLPIMPEFAGVTVAPALDCTVFRTERGSRFEHADVVIAVRGDLMAPEYPAGTLLFCSLHRRGVTPEPSPVTACVSEGEDGTVYFGIWSPEKVSVRQSPERAIAGATRPLARIEEVLRPTVEEVEDGGISNRKE